MPFMDSNADEKKLGLELFFTDTPGIKGRIKKEPKDFIVTERSMDIEPASKETLESRDPNLPIYLYAKVWSKNWETNRLIQYLAKGLGISTDNIYFAGSKDKRAITTQLMAFETTVENLKSISLEDVKFSNFQISTRPLKIGDLLGNDFEINITELELSTDEALDLIAATENQLAEVNGFPNFFGVQRFGIIRPVTHMIGKHLIEKNFEKAVLMYIGHPIKGEPTSDYEARAEFDKCWDFEWARKNYPKHLVFEKKLINYLLGHPDDYIGAIQQLPKNLSTMFIHSYQSFLFNKILCRRLRVGLPINEPVLGDIVLPMDKYRLPVHKDWISVDEGNLNKLRKMCLSGKAFVSGVLFGSESQFAKGEFGEIEQKIIVAEGFSAKDFVIPEFSQISSKGTRRELKAPLSDFKYEVLDDLIKFTFGLIKGSYATTLLREYMKSAIRNY
jgi:tRNA pseudouridine13 synthase